MPIPVDYDSMKSRLHRHLISKTDFIKVKDSLNDDQMRIYVNDELGEIDRGLIGAERLLAPGGCLAVVSFHSLEDKRVKAFVNARSGNLPNPSRHVPDAGGSALEPTFRLIKKGAIKPGVAECKSNPRARSSRLRIAVRTAAPAWNVNEGRAA